MDELKQRVLEAMVAAMAADGNNDRAWQAISAGLNAAYTNNPRAGYEAMLEVLTPLSAPEPETPALPEPDPSTAGDAPLA